MKYRYDAAWKSDKGYLQCPDCAQTSDGRSLFRHYRRCASAAEGLKGCVYVFGPEQVRRAVARAQALADDRAAWYGVSVAVLREQGFEQLLTSVLATSS